MTAFQVPDAKVILHSPPAEGAGRHREDLISDRAAPETTKASPAAPAVVAGRIDKSTLSLPEPKRLRDKAHLRFVAAQPCLICGRHPSDPHHLRFAQPTALGLKVSDELCRGHHRQVHQTGNEAAWWEDLVINALEIAKGLWEQSRTSKSSTQEPVNDLNVTVSNG
jgi:hypothetical protein